MAAEGIARVDLVIDANGLAKTGRSLQTLERYMDKLRKRAEALSRVQVTLNVKLSDCLCGPMKAIRTKLTELTSRIWEIPVKVIEPTFDEKLFATAGANAGGVFFQAFLSQIDASQVRDKLQKAANGVQPTSSSGAKSDSKSKKDGWFGSEFWKDIAKDVISSVISDSLSKGAEKMLSKRKSKKSLPSEEPPSKTRSLIVTEDKPKSSFLWADETTKIPVSPSKPSFKEKMSSFFKGKDSAFTQGANKVAKFGLKSAGTSVLKSLSGKAVDAAFSLGDQAFGGAKKLSLKSIGNGLLGGAGKLIKPLGFAMDVADIAKAKPGEERNRAIGRAVGGGVGSLVMGAIGTAILPGVGTAVLSAAGDMAGEWVGDKIGGAVSKIKKVWPFGKKNKKKAPEAVPAPSATISPLSPGLSPVPNVKPSSPVNVNIPTGAVQLTVQNPDIDYDAVALEIGTRMSLSIKQAVENRAS